MRRIERTASHRGKISNEYDLSGLVAKLKAFEPEFREVAEEAKARKNAVTRPGFRMKRKETEVSAAAGTAPVLAG